MTAPKAARGSAWERGGTPARSRQLRAQGQETVRKLLDASLVVLGERGFHAMRVKDIVERANTSHGTFYLYFGSKDDLFRALVDDLVVEMRELAARMPDIGPGADGLRSLRDWLAQFAELYARTFPVSQAWNEANIGDRQLARQGGVVLRGFIDRLVEQRVGAGQVTGGSPETAALAMVAMIERTLTFSLTGLVDTTLDDVIDTLAGILHVGMFGGRRTAATPRRAPLSARG